MNRLPLLLSSLALAAAASATPSASATSSVDFSYSLASGLSLSLLPTSSDGRASGQYVYNWGDDGEATNLVFEYLIDVPPYTAAPVEDPTRYTVTHAGGTSIAQGGGHFRMSATSAATFASALGDPSDLFYFRRYGVRLFFSVTNHGSAAQDFTFDLGTQRRTLDVSTDVPYRNNLGQYAEAGGTSDVIDLSVGQSDDYTRMIDTADSASGTHDSLDTTFPGSRTFTVAANATGEFEMYASAYVFIEDDHRQPVPEPASLAALSAGALGLLRRRRVWIGDIPAT